MASFFETHRALLDKAVAAAASRTYWSPYPEAPSGKIYGETAKADAEAAFKAMLGKPFEMDHPGGDKRVGKEESPWGFPLGIGYPQASIDALVAASQAAGKGWAAASIETRAGVCLEILHRINRQSFLVGQAIMHTTGQGFAMAFQAGGPHAQDRGLEAVAYAYAEMTKVPASARWEKPQGGGADPIRLDKQWRIVPRGVAVTIGCATFPTWNGYPSIFASLATGNTVIVKPHPMAILPLAISVRIAREVLREAGFDPDVVLLAPDTAEAPVSKELATHPGVGIVDFTGSNAFGKWVRENAAGKQVFTEEAGVNSIVIDSTASFKGMCQNIAFSLSLYSGQMCTAPQNIYVPRAGIETDEGHKSFDEVAKGIAGTVDKLVGSPERAAGILGAIQSPATLQRVKDVSAKGKVLLASRAYEPPGTSGARTATPAILAADADNAADSALVTGEQFGPISFVIATASTADAIAKAAGLAKQKGAITAAVYSTSDTVLDAAADAFSAAGVSLSCNLTGGIFVNQSAAFSDYHVSGANPAGNACLTDAAFVASRFRVAGVRRPVAA
jgi:phenylacetic acid degradation protein paaN